VTSSYKLTYAHPYDHAYTRPFIPTSRARVLHLHTRPCTYCTCIHAPAHAWIPPHCIPPSPAPSPGALPERPAATRW
jgi:hypothetical protein